MPYHRPIPDPIALPVKSPPGRIAVTLTQRAAEGADAAQVGDTVVAMWQKIDAALTPIIGNRSVVALYMRSLHLIAPAHPWLSGLQQDVQARIDLAGLKSLLSQQDSQTAAVAGGEMLRTFYELLTSLVGASLAERLLHCVWEDSPSGLPAQDTSP